MKRFIKSSGIDAAKTTLQLLAVDTSAKADQKKHTAIYSGFINEKSLQDLLATKKIIERQALAFHMEAQDFIQGVVQKIVDKAPVQYKLVPNLSCLFPSLISESKTSCLSRLMNVLLDLTAAISTQL